MSLIQMSVSGATLILVTLLIRALALHKLPKRFFVTLWGLAALRLLAPFSVPSPFSVFSLWRGPAVSVADSTLPISPAEAQQLTNPLVGRARELASGTPAPSVDVWAVVWIVGMAACALFYGLAYLKCRREFRESLPVSNQYAEDWLRDHPLIRTVSIRQSDKISAPLTYGVFRPVILMPKTTGWDDTATINYVLAHEFEHIRRFDGLFKLLLIAALCVHWFNPMVWVMLILANRDIELACDEAVLRRFGTDSRGGYALALIRMEESRSGFPLLGSHFSKNAIEERIQAIMKMNKKSWAALAIALVLVVGTVTLFATSAKADSPAAGTELEGDALLLRNDADDELYYSSDGGETWVHMTQEEFEERTSIPNVVWWTAEEYTEWLENEKKELQTIIGSQGWTSSTGWFTWTQEKVDETIAQYEEILAQIRDGYLVSKTVDGSEDTMLVMNPLDVLLGGYEVLEDVQEAAPGTDNQALFTEYADFGLDFDREGNLLWNGQRVRIFVDGVEHEDGFYSQYDHYDPDGEIDLHTVRSKVDNGDGSYNFMGPLMRIEEFVLDQMFLDALEGQKYVDDMNQHVEDDSAQELEPYTPFGLRFGFDRNQKTGSLSMEWNGKPVRSLFDPVRQLWVCNSLGTTGLDLEAVYKNGKLTGLQIAEDNGREFVEAGAVLNAETTSASGGDASGETIAERMERYAPYGISCMETDGGRVVFLYSKPVRVFVDKQPDGSVFTVESTGGGEIPQASAYYDSKGTLAGVSADK